MAGALGARGPRAAGPALGAGRIRIARRGAAKRRSCGCAAALDPARHCPAPAAAALDGGRGARRRAGLGRLPPLPPPAAGRPLRARAPGRAVARRHQSRWGASARSATASTATSAAAPVASAGSRCTSASMTRPAWPTSRCCRPPPRPTPSRSCAGGAVVCPPRGAHRAAHDRQRRGLPRAALLRAVPELQVRHIRTRPYTPRTNGKAERFIQTLLREWAYVRPYRSSASAPPCRAYCATTTAVRTRASTSPHRSSPPGARPMNNVLGLDS